MTLPINITLPLDASLIKSDDPEALLTYMKKLIYVLGYQLQQTNQTVNGSLTLLNDTSYPFVVGSVPASPSTTSYSNCSMWIRRSNLLTQIWFDVSWSGSTDTGNLLIQVPYASQPSQQSPYVGVIESDSMTYGSGYTYLTANIIPGTNTIGVNQNGSGKAVLALPISSSGHLRGSIQYVGQQFS